jgi:hypothetical protein
LRGWDWGSDARAAVGARAFHAGQGAGDAQFLLTGGAAKPKDVREDWRGPRGLIKVAHGKVGFRSISRIDKFLSVSMETIMIQTNR